MNYPAVIFGEETKYVAARATRVKTLEAVLFGASAYQLSCAVLGGTVSAPLPDLRRVTMLSLPCVKSMGKG